MEKLAVKAEASNEVDDYLRAYNNAETWLAEVLDGSMRTKFEYGYNNQELVAEDGQSLGQIFSKSIQDAEELARQKPNLLFELRRRQIEMEEYRDMLAMADGRQGNTMVAISDFPQELMDASQDIGGYNMRRKQTMLRVLTWRDGRMFMRTQSLDGSNRQALEAIYQHFGLEAGPGELLGQRINLELGSDEQETLVDRLTGVYDRSLSWQQGGEWYAGRRAEDRRDTYDFVRSQPEIVDRLAWHELNGNLSQTEIYNVAALMAERFESSTQVGEAFNLPSAGNFDGSWMSLERQLADAGDRAAKQGQQFSGCGGSVSKSSESEDELNQAGFGNKANQETSYKFNKYMYCASCQAPPKNEKESKKMCGPCGLCRACDKKYGGKG